VMTPRWLIVKSGGPRTLSIFLFGYVPRVLITARVIGDGQAVQHSFGCRQLSELRPNKLLEADVLQMRYMWPAPDASRQHLTAGDDNHSKPLHEDSRKMLA